MNPMQEDLLEEEGVLEDFVPEECIVKIEDLNLEKVRGFLKDFTVWAIAPEPKVFVKGMLIDIQSTNVIVTVCDNGFKKFDQICTNPHKLAWFLDKMWKCVK